MNSRVYLTHFHPRPGEHLTSSGSSGEQAHTHLTSSHASPTLNPGLVQVAGLAHALGQPPLRQELQQQAAERERLGPLWVVAGPQADRFSANLIQRRFHRQ